MKTKPTSLVIAALAALSFCLLAACNSTSVSDTWTAPDVSKISFKKIMVVATIPDGAARRDAEDALKAQITRAECITSYSLLGAVTDLKDLSKVRGAIKAAGVDGIIVMRPVSDKTEVTAVYPMPYRTFSGYYSRDFALFPFFNDSGEFAIDRIVRIETNIYEAAGDHLIWSGATTSINPGNVQELIRESAEAIRAELVKQKLIPQNSLEIPSPK